MPPAGTGEAEQPFSAEAAGGETLLVEARPKVPVPVAAKGQRGRWHGCAPRAGCICAGTADAEKLAYERAWSFVEHVFCICLRERGDRLEEASDQFHERGLCRRVVFYRPDRPTSDDMEIQGVRCRGLFGVWRSHQTVALRAAALQSARTLVFEDDVLFHEARSSPCGVARAGRALSRLERAGRRWEVFYLGHIPFFALPVRADLGVWRTFSMMAHAYVLSATGACKLASRDYAADARLHGRERGIDAWLMCGFTQYAPRRMLCVQSGSRSSNTQNSAAPTDFWYDQVVPFGIEAHRDATGAFEAFTYFLVPLLAVLLLAWAARSRRRAALLCVLAALALLLCLP